MTRHLENYGASLGFAAFFSGITGLVLDIDVVETEAPGDRLGACRALSARCGRVSLCDFVGVDTF